jgi:hypothetical protein
MKSLTSLWKVLANEMASRCGTSTTKDIKTVQGRTEHEGLSFFTITLPSFGKDFQHCLDQGLVPHESFLAFKKVGSCLPSFLRGFTEAVFDPGTGILLEEPDIESIFAIRQLTLIFSKMLLPCTPAREREALSDYIQCDKEVKENDAQRLDSDLFEFNRMGGLLFGALFSCVDSDIYHGRIVPKHGPGATAEKLTSNGKYSTRYWTDRLESVFHVGDFLYPSLRHIGDGYDDVDFLEPDMEMPSRVISVPKTQKGPRIIAIEPSSVQYVQQGLLESITHHTRSSYLNGFIGSDSQEPNQLLAQKGSVDGTLATLDLSEASDRVSSELVWAMLARNPLTREAVYACRTERASVPGMGIIPLSKFASMGSALCFPIEAMVFLTIIFLSIEKEQGYRFTKSREFLPFLGSVRVYGDDLIVPIEYVHTVVDLLEHFGAKVGRHKSFWIGKFRESCGKDYYHGHDVSIVKARQMFPLQRQQVAETISIVSLRNQFYFSGCWDTVKWLDEQIGKVLNHYPTVEPSSSALGRHSFLGYVSEKEHEYLHSPLVKAYVESSVSPRDHLDGPGALLKYFLKRGSDPFFDGRHLERAGRPRTVRIKARWVSPF